ncbi:MAG: ATP-grasp domain-containing protein [Xanthobacter sp.]
MREVLLLEGGAPLPPPQPGLRTIVLPLMEQHIRQCPRQMHEGLFPSRGTVDVFANKSSFAQYARSHGLGTRVPQAYDPDAPERFPCVFKLFDLNAGEGVEVVDSPDALTALLERPGWKGQPVLAQAFVSSSHEYVTHAVCRAGQIITQVTYRQTRGEQARIMRPGHSNTRRRVRLPEAWKAILELFLQPLAYDGICNFDYVEGADGYPCVLEINPRLGGSLMVRKNVGDLAKILRSLIDLSQPLAVGAGLPPPLPSVSWWARIMSPPRNGS